MVIDLRQEAAPNSGFMVTLQKFEGPLDLLLQMIRSQEIDIYDIPIASVTDQYLFHLRAMEEMDLDVASEYLVMAATLIEIKSRFLLPKPPAPEQEEGPDPRDELVRRLLEYEKYRQVADLLHGHEDAQRLLHARTVELDPDDLPAVPSSSVTTLDLLSALKRVLQNVGDVVTAPVTTIPRQKITLRMKMAEMMRRVHESGSRIPFSQLFAAERTRPDIVMAFLALLELMRQFKIVAEQDQQFGEIFISPAVQVEQKALAQ
ncbi:MAG: segregation/condensation protein A [Armatimonadetes bacterium]|nr:segregation/condensation protein A [Armatimonadota bacterium]